MIDLHVHSNLSDGTDDYIEILKKAESKKLTYISITDHDNCKVYKELEKIKISDYYSGKIIPGVELKTIVLGVPIELLGYGVDIEIINEKVKNLYLTFEEKNIIEMQRLYNVCRKIGINFSKDLLEKYDGKEKYASTYIHKEIIKDEENRKYITDELAWREESFFYRKYMCNPNNIFYTDVTDLIPSCDKIIHLIKEAGGLVFIPHIYLYGKNSKEILEYLISNYNIDGIECYHSTFTTIQSNFLVEYCKKNNIYISGGSDYHGNSKPNIELGIGKNNLNIPEEILDDWIKNIKLFN